VITKSQRLFIVSDTTQEIRNDTKVDAAAIVSVDFAFVLLGHKHVLLSVFNYQRITVALQKLY